MHDQPRYPSAPADPWQTTAIHQLPAHSRHAISWRLHAVAAHVVGHYRNAIGFHREALA